MPVGGTEWYQTWDSSMTESLVQEQAVLISFVSKQQTSR